MASLDPPDDLRSLRDALRVGSDVLVVLAKLELSVADLKHDLDRIDKRTERTETALAEVGVDVNRINGSVARHEADISAIKARNAADDLRQAHDDGFRDGRSTAVLTWGQWKVWVAVLGATATLASLVAAVVATADRWM